MSPADKQSLPVQDIILDTNILQYLSDKNISGDLLGYLLELSNKHFMLAISNISVCELLSGTTRKQENDGMTTLSLFKRFQIDDNVLVASSQLSTLYGMEKISSLDISLADKIIAATAILTGSCILTADINDFPRPFFKEIEERLFFFTHKNRKQMRVMQLLSPNMEIVDQRFNERPEG